VSLDRHCPAFRMIVDPSGSSSSSRMATGEESAPEAGLCRCCNWRDLLPPSSWQKVLHLFSTRRPSATYRRLSERPGRAYCSTERTLSCVSDELRILKGNSVRKGTCGRPGRGL